jgi:hypothetical protein
MINPGNPCSAQESVEARKTRERLEFLVLPSAEAQRQISLNLRGPLRDLTPFGQELRSPLETALRDDEAMDE